VAHVSFIVIFGTRWTFRPVVGGWDGKLNCPDCRQPTRMVELEAVKAFTLYWFSLWKLESGGRLLECKECFSKFHLPPELEDGPGPAGHVAAEPVTEGPAVD
jgi:hypothetical protein